MRSGFIQTFISHPLLGYWSGRTMNTRKRNNNSQPTLSNPANRSDQSRSYHSPGDPLKTGQLISPTYRSVPRRNRTVNSDNRLARLYQSSLQTAHLTIYASGDLTDTTPFGSFYSDESDPISTYIQGHSTPSDAASQHTDYFLTSEQT